MLQVDNGDGLLVGFRSHVQQNMESPQDFYQQEDSANGRPKYFLLFGTTREPAVGRSTFMLSCSFLTIIVTCLLMYIDLYKSLLAVSAAHKTEQR